MLPNLVLIQDNLAHRYVNGKLDQTVEIDLEQGSKQVRKDIEYFRVYGVEFDEVPKNSDTI